MILDIIWTSSQINDIYSINQRPWKSELLMPRIIEASQLTMFMLLNLMYMKGSLFAYNFSCFQVHSVIIDYF